MVFIDVTLDGWQISHGRRTDGLLPEFPLPFLDEFPFRLDEVIPNVWGISRQEDGKVAWNIDNVSKFAGRGQLEFQKGPLYNVWHLVMKPNT
jgi:hypothetical protein